MMAPVFCRVVSEVKFDVMSAAVNSRRILLPGDVSTPSYWMGDIAVAGSRLGLRINQAVIPGAYGVITAVFRINLTERSNRRRITIGHAHMTRSC